MRTQFDLKHTQGLSWEYCKDITDPVSIIFILKCPRGAQRRIWNGLNGSNGLNGLNIYFESIRGLETADGFAHYFLEEMDNEIPVLWFICIIFFFFIVPDKSFVGDECRENVEIVGFTGNCRDIDDITEPLNGGILVDAVFDVVDEPREFHEGE
jgi:hypothetical protein